MLDFLNSVKSLVKAEQVTTDNNVFKLHYKVTVIMLILFSILLTSKQYFGEPIICDTEKRPLIETYCWITGTYIIEDSLTAAVLPGLGNVYRAGSSHKKPEEQQSPIIWQKYYQWVCIIFSVQALFFYLPRYFWTTWEGGRLKMLVKDFNGPLVPPGWSNSAKIRLLDYLLSGRYSHEWYSVRYTVCEVLNFIIVFLQIYLLDYVLTGHFSLYGLRVLLYNDINPMTHVFPKITKCKYDNYGPTGSIQHYDALCVLPLNILNEKLFLILWFWFFILAIISFIALIYRALVILTPRFRMYLLRAQARCISVDQARVIISYLSYGDFFLLYFIGRNVNPIIYKEIVNDLHDCIIGKRPCKRINGYTDTV